MFNLKSPVYMYSKLKFILFFAPIFLFQSCLTEQPLVVKKADNNRTYTVEYLFEHDGCKVYRFRDNGNYVYFTNYKNSTTSVVNDSVQIKTYSVK